MPHCIKCNSILGDNVVECPICGAYQDNGDDVKIDNINKTLSNSPNVMNIEYSGESYEDSKLELERLINRGDECFKSGKLWLGAKNRTRARKEFQRAYKYYETALKLDPNNEKVRDMRSKCLFKMA
jgi:tetratricopeptide (TPR) repeat protein